MPPQIKQAKLETLEAIIKEVEGLLEKSIEEKSPYREAGLTHTTVFYDGIGFAYKKLLAKLKAEKELLENSK